MNIEIKKLSPKLVDDYIKFFDTTALETKENKCYCICWCSADHSAIDDLAAQNRRELATEYVKNGTLQGYLAYNGEQVIGWCNANEKNNCTRFSIKVKCNKDNVTVCIKNLGTLDTEYEIKLVDSDNRKLNFNYL